MKQKEGHGGADPRDDGAQGRKIPAGKGTVKPKRSAADRASPKDPYFLRPKMAILLGNQPVFGGIV
jgi:hypothetical protein